MPVADHEAKGATMMFGEKYGDGIRVVDVPNVSMELCAHAASYTSEIAVSKSSANLASLVAFDASKPSPVLP